MSKRNESHREKAEAIILRAIEYAAVHYKSAINGEHVIARRTALVDNYAAPLSALAIALKMVST